MIGARTSAILWTARTCWTPSRNGALGIEALSRGATSCTFFEKDRKALHVLRENVVLAKLDEVVRIMPSDVTKPPKAQTPASLIFLDPPYRKGLIEQAVAALSAQGWTRRTLGRHETAKNEALSLSNNYEEILTRGYGDTCIRFFKNS